MPARIPSRSRRSLPLPVLAAVALALALGLALLFGPALLRAATAETKLLASDAAPGDLLGASMSIRGRPLIISAPFDSSGWRVGTSAGAAHIHALAATSPSTAGVTTPGLIPATGIALLVTSVESAPDGLVTVLADNGCAADLLAITEAGAFNSFLVGAPPIVNEAFPLALAPRTAFFVRCLNREAGSGTPGLVDLPMEPTSWRVEYLAEEYRPLPSVEFVDGVLRIAVGPTAAGNSPRVSVWSSQAPVVTAGDRYVMEAEARTVTNDGTFLGNYLVGLNAVAGAPQFYQHWHLGFTPGDDLYGFYGDWTEEPCRTGVALDDRFSHLSARI